MVGGLTEGWSLARIAGRQSTVTLNFVHATSAVRVIFGAGARASVNDEVALLGGTRMLLVAAERQHGPAGQLAEDLERNAVARLTDVVMHVPADLAARAVATARSSRADVVVALGGGSATGLAKAVAKETSLPIVAVPTTYAGSEMTPIWGITAGTHKLTGTDPLVLPRTVIYDPELTVSMPMTLVASSGMNALAHSVEGLYGPRLSPVTNLIAADSIRALASALPSILDDPAGPDGWAEALYGAWLAGWTLGSTGMGIHHKVCHVLGGAYNLPHSPVHSAVLPYAAWFNEQHAPAAMTSVAGALQRAGRPAERAPVALWHLTRATGAPASLADVGLRRDQIDEAAALVVAEQPTNPRPVELAGVTALLRAAYDGEPPSSDPL
jgi:maleylacetate reductase